VKFNAALVTLLSYLDFVHEDFLHAKTYTQINTYGQSYIRDYLTLDAIDL
jgi:hypothetical protein